MVCRLSEVEGVGDKVTTCVQLPVDCSVLAAGLSRSCWR
jgi:hypothetical protein